MCALLISLMLVAHRDELIVTRWVELNIVELLMSTVARTLSEWFKAVLACVFGKRAACNVSTNYNVSLLYGPTLSAKITVTIHPQVARIGVGSITIAFDWSGDFMTNSVMYVKVVSQITGQPFRVTSEIARVEHRVKFMCAHPSVQELQRAAHDLMETLMIKQIIGLTERLIAYLHETYYAPLRARTLPLRRG